MTPPPLTAYLDTCIVSGLAEEDLRDEELDALLRILEKYKGKKVHLVTSNLTKRELEKISAGNRRKHSFIYSLLFDVPIVPLFRRGRGLSFGGIGGGIGTGGGFRVHPIFARLNTELKDEGDALHIYQAARNEVSYFLTTDHKTVLSRKVKIEDICGVKAVSPTEFLTIIEGGE